MTQHFDSEFVIKSADDADGDLVTKALADFGKTFDARLDEIEARLQRKGLTGEQPQADADLETKAFGRYLRSGDAMLGADEKKSLNASTDAQGGYLAPEEFANEILKNLVELNPFRQVARVVSMGAGEIIIPVRTAAPAAQWVTETGARPSATMAYDQKRFEVHEVAAYVDVSNRLLEDAAFNIGAEISGDLATEFAKIEGDAFITGDGTGKPQGVLDAYSNALITGSTVAALNADVLVDLFHSLPTAYATNAVWMMNRQTLGVLRKLKDTTARPLWAEGLAMGNPNMLLGRPVVEMPAMPDAEAGASPILFGDFKAGYRIFDRIGLSMLRDPYTQAGTGQVRFLARRRVGGGVVKAEAIRGLSLSV